MALLEKPITTQEEFDAAIGQRLARERETSAKRYEGWMSPEDIKKLTDAHAEELKKLTDAADANAKALAEKDALIAQGDKYRTDLEKTRIAIAAGLDPKYADRLVGSNADEWKSDAEALAKDFAAAHTGAPIGSPERSGAPQTADDIAKQKFGEFLSGIL